MSASRARRPAAEGPVLSEGLGGTAVRTKLRLQNCASPGFCQMLNERVPGLTGLEEKVLVRVGHEEDAQDVVRNFSVERTIGVRLVQDLGFSKGKELHAADVPEHMCSELCFGGSPCSLHGLRGRIRCASEQALGGAR